MGYIGQTVSIPLGQLGLRTDDPMSSLPPNSFIMVSNVNLYSSRINKVGGSTRYNTTALDGAVVSLREWYPTPSLKRLIAVTSTGKIYRDAANNFNSATAITSSLGTLTPDCMMVVGGAEVAGNNRKLFIFTGGSAQLKRITGDGTSTANISAPPADWSATFPTGGFIYQGRLFAYGNSSDPHRLYVSDADDHEDFTTATLTFPVFPGEGDGIIGAVVYRGVAVIFKRPYGVYILDGTDTNTSNWVVKRFSDAFGIASPNSAVQILGDLLVANANGSITSLSASLQFGDLEAGDILANAQVEEYFRENSSSTGISKTTAIYYPEKKTALFSFRSPTGTKQNRLLYVDVGRQSPRIYTGSKDQVTCLALRKDANGIERPIYGSDDGFVYQMDQTTFNVNGSAYTSEFQTPHMDLGFADSSLSSKNKIFDFLEIEYRAAGNWPFYVDVYIDGLLSETLTVNQTTGVGLGAFVLGTDRLSTLTVNKARQPLHGVGKTVGFRYYNTAANQNFEIEKYTISFRVSGEDNVP